jgi:hypothetical protein
MENNEPLDKATHQVNALTAREVIHRLQKHGFYEAYETGNGGIEIKGESSLKCQVIKNSDNSWTPDVSVEWLSAYVLIPSVAFSILGQVVGFSGTIPLVISALLGLGLGNLLLENKKKATLQRLEDAVFE